MSRAPRICCLDLDTFFVSVERLLRPELRGVPVVVGGERWGRGVVTSCSYETREHGVRSGMSIREASRLAPARTVFVRGSHRVYGPYAQQVRDVLLDFTPEVRTASIDEFYLDFSGCERLYARPSDAHADATIERVVRTMRQAIQDRVHLPASAGIGCTRVIAKMATRPAKPAGVIMVRAGQEWEFLRPLPVRALPGIGPSTQTRLERDGVHTLGQLLTLPSGPVRQRHAGSVHRLLHALDGDDRGGLGRDRPAFREHDPQGLTVGSISNERTFFAALDDRAAVERQLLALADRVCWRARKRGVRARTVTLKLRTADFRTLTRARTGPATHQPDQVYRVVRELLQASWDRRQRVRLLGIALTGLQQPSPQLALPWVQASPPQAQAARAVDSLRARFGFDMVRLGVATPVSRVGSDASERGPIPESAGRHASRDQAPRTSRTTSTTTPPNTTPRPVTTPEIDSAGPMRPPSTRR